MQNSESLVTPHFFLEEPMRDEAESKKAGRPIFKEGRELVTIRLAADKNYRPIMPAHAMWKRIDGQEITYAMRWPEQYQRFKSGREQVAVGTPLDELPFLTKSKASELKALAVYTVEALASLDGKNLQMLGIEGRKLKEQANAYMSKASGSADVTAMASENAELKAQIEYLRSQQAQEVAIPEVEPEWIPADEETDFSEWSDDELRERIKEVTGKYPAGQPRRETLEMMARKALGSEAA